MNLYALPAAIGERVTAAASKPALLLDLLEAASRQMDVLCARHFWTGPATRQMTAADGETLWPDDDLLSLTALAVDRDGTGVYGESWAATDYTLWPRTTLPLVRIAKARLGRYGFPPHELAVQITGVWGYGDGRRAEPWDALACAVTLADASATDATLSVGGVIEAGMTLRLGSEQMYVAATGSATTTPEGEEEPVTTYHATVVRGVNGTTAAAQTGVTAEVAAYPGLIRAAVINLTVDAWMELGGVEMSSEKIGNYEYVRNNLGTVAKFRSDQLARMIGAYVRGTA